MYGSLSLTRTPHHTTHIHASPLEETPTRHPNENETNVDRSWNTLEVLRTFYLIFGLLKKGKSGLVSDNSWIVYVRIWSMGV
jgi:hypothetical protein